MTKVGEAKYTTYKRIVGMVTVIGEEIDSPFFYVLSDIGKILHCVIPKSDLILYVFSFFKV